MKRLSILFTFLIIIISGCIGQETPIVSTKDGVIITDFSFEHSPVYAEDNVGLRLEVQNVGGNEAELKKIQVYGVDFDCIDTTRAWCNKGADPTEFDGTYIGEDRFLDPPNTEINFEGGKCYHEWRLQAPSGVTSETNYDFRVRVKYDYNTTYSGMIRVIDDIYIQSLKEDEKQKLFSSGGLVSSEVTNGPISITPYSSRHFIVSPGDQKQKRPIKFKIENVGKGYPYIKDPVSGDIRNYHIKIIEIGGITDCDKDPTNGEIKLSSGKSHTINCKFETPTTDGFTNKLDKPFQIRFEYSYYVDGSTSITVKPAY